MEIFGNMQQREEDPDEGQEDQEAQTVGEGSR